MKKILLLLLILCTTFCLTGCKYSDNKKAAFKEAQKYLKDKYDLSVNKKDVMKTYLDLHEHGQYHFTPDYKGTAMVELYLSPKTFKVFVDYENKDTSTYYDNYEADKIQADLEKIYKKEIGLSNIQVIVPEDFVLNPVNNQKYNNNINDYLEKVNQLKEFKVAIITTGNVNKVNLQKIAKYNNIKIILYKVSKYIDNSTLESMYNPKNNIYDSIEYNYDKLIIDKIDCTSGICQ